MKERVIAETERKRLVEEEEEAGNVMYVFHSVLSLSINFNPFCKDSIAL